MRDGGRGTRTRVLRLVREHGGAVAAEPEPFVEPELCVARVIACD